MTLWVFGDSYVADHKKDYQWFKQLGKLLDMPVETKGEAGWSNDFIANQVYLHAINGDITKDDFVIQIQTQYSRTWFFEDRPHLSNFVHHTDATAIGMSKKEKSAAEQWVRHLYNDKQLIWQTYANNHASVSILHQMCGCKVLTLPAFWNQIEAFNPYIGVRGSLTEWISYLEFDTTEEYDQTLGQPGGDTRLNHLNEHNHGVLAQKLHTAITSTGQIDLMTGFKTRAPRKDDFATAKEFREFTLENIN